MTGRNVVTLGKGSPQKSTLGTCAGLVTAPGPRSCPEHPTQGALCSLKWRPLAWPAQAPVPSRTPDILSTWAQAPSTLRLGRHRASGQWGETKDSGAQEMLLAPPSPGLQAVSSGPGRPDPSSPVG